MVYFRVIDPLKAIIEVQDYYTATQLLAQTTLRSVCGQMELDDLLAEREKVNAQLAEILDKQTEPWGIKVTLVEVRSIDLPIEMQRAIAKQAEAERERRAKVINAEGEFQAAAKRWPTRPRCWPPSPCPCSCATSRPCGRSPRRRTPLPCSPSPSI